MAGMAEVGRLFNNNELIVAEVLQSAEAMKAAVNHLEQFMEKSETSARGKIVLATVKGDVHDIGKNLVEIILRNNGYQVINLGHQSSARGSDPGLARAQAGRHRALRPAGEERAPDGDHGVRFQRPRRAAFRCWSAAPRCRKNSRRRDRPGLRRSHVLRQRRDDRPAPHERAHGPGHARGRCSARTSSRPPVAAPAEPAPVVNTATARSPKVRTDIPIPAAPYLDRRVRDVPNLAEVWSYINPFMLYGRHLGFKGNFEKLLAERDPKALELFHQDGRGQSRKPRSS